MPLVTADRTLVQAVELLASQDPELRDAWDDIPRELHDLFRHPENYIGRAQEKVEGVCKRANAYLKGD